MTLLSRMANSEAREIILRAVSVRPTDAAQPRAPFASHSEAAPFSRAAVGCSGKLDGDLDTLDSTTEQIEFTH